MSKQNLTSVLQSLKHQNRLNLSLKRISDREIKKSIYHGVNLIINTMIFIICDSDKNLKITTMNDCNSVTKVQL